MCRHVAQRGSMLAHGSQSNSSLIARPTAQSAPHSVRRWFEYNAQDAGNAVELSVISSVSSVLRVTTDA